ncbi:hypothetical protein NIES25_46640 [Nostoc linckia NIES-25]|nr:hypothetical protein NIES25_46640 [Nostoc linckia NIES-25]
MGVLTRPEWAFWPTPQELNFMHYFSLDTLIVLQIRPLAKVLFALLGKREKAKGERDNTEPFPLPLSPFPDLCKKSIVPLPNSAINSNVETLQLQRLYKNFDIMQNCFHT